MSKPASSFHIGETVGPYRILDAEDPTLEDASQKAKAIGMGASAEVCLARQTLAAGITIDRALKFYSPSSKILARRKEAGLSSGQASFLEEIKAISSFNHQNLVKIVDAGKHRDHPFFVMEYVDGAPLLLLIDRTTEDFLKWQPRAATDAFLVLRMVRQICWPIAYLHTFRFFHFDIAPKNIFVREVNDRPHLILGDLGVGRSIPSPGDPSLAQMEDIFIGGTREYTPAVLHPYLNRKPIPASEIAKYATYWDVFAIATVLEELIAKWGLDQNPDLIATRIICTRAKQYDEGFDALRLTTELERLLPTQVLTAGVQELSSDAFGKRTYVPIPLYSVPLSERIEKIVSHPLIVRLQKVPQFQLGRTVFPGGVHTRYEHALGTYALGQRYLIKLLSHPDFRAYFSKKELEEALVAILLSKLVSFVFDYAFFELFLSNDPDEDAANRIERLRLFLSMRSFGTQETLQDVILQQFPDVDLEGIISIIAGRPNDSRQAKLTSSIIKSSIDVRVMDYIARDSHHTGVPAGEGIDVGHIINSLTWSPVEATLGITRNGIYSVEHLLCARYWMYNRVYWNQINRSLASMIRYSLYALIKAGDLSATHFIREVMNLDEPSALQWLNETWDATTGEVYRYASILAPLRLPRPRHYRLLLELSGKTWSKRYIESARKSSPDQLEELRLEFIQSCSFNQRLTVSSLLFDIPRDKVLKLGEDVHVETEKGKWEKLIDVSDIIRALPDAFLETAFKFRVFYSGELELKEDQRVSLGKEVKSFLETKFK